jgi:hypothetical protein
VSSTLNSTAVTSSCSKFLSRLEAGHRKASLRFAISSPDLHALHSLGFYWIVPFWRTHCFHLILGELLLSKLHWTQQAVTASHMSCVFTKKEELETRAPLWEGNDQNTYFGKITVSMI